MFFWPLSLNYKKRMQISDSKVENQVSQEEGRLYAYMLQLMGCYLDSKSDNQVYLTREEVKRWGPKCRQLSTGSITEGECRRLNQSVWVGKQIRNRNRWKSKSSESKQGPESTQQPWRSSSGGKKVWREDTGGNIDSNTQRRLTRHRRSQSRWQQSWQGNNKYVDPKDRWQEETTAQ